MRTTIEGPGAADVGPMVTNDTPVALEALPWPRAAEDR